MCPSPPGIPVGSAVSDPDGDGDGIYGEADQFDQDCNLYGLTALSTVTKRGLDELTLDDLRAWYNAQEEQLIISHGGEDLNLGFHWEAKFDPFDVGNHSVAARDARLLEKRTFDNGAVLKFCAAGAPQANIYPQTYSGYRTIAKLANKGWVAIAKPAICGAIGVASFATKPANTEFVTEHVFEKQSLRDYLEYMTLGQLPGGGVLAAGKTTVTGIFDAGGVGNPPVFPISGKSPTLTGIRFIDLLHLLAGWHDVYLGNQPRGNSLRSSRACGSTGQLR